jgi:hypothetical protein
MLLPAVIAFVLVPDWRKRWLFSPYPWLAVLLAMVVFSPVLIWNAEHDWASFRFQLVRATVLHPISLLTVGDFLGLQFGLVGIIMLPVVLSANVLTAWRGYRSREPIAILLSTSVLVPFLYFLWKSLTIRIGDTWPMFFWPIGFAATAINLTMLAKDGWSARMMRSSLAWTRAAIVSGIAIVVLVFLYYVASPWNFLRASDPNGSEAGFAELAARVEADMKKADATWIAATDYRTYAMLRWHLKGRVPVVQINERKRFLGFADPGMTTIEGHTALFIVREPDNRLPIWTSIGGVREPLDRIDRVWRGAVMDIYDIEKLTGFTPNLSPPEDSPMFPARPLAGDVTGENVG